ncbi:MAG: hypothetical protein IJ155_10360 [Prevotella sp.]|nr:hypothetical protein [Prevotella sp.]
MKRRYWLFLIVGVLLLASFVVFEAVKKYRSYDHKVVVCIPVYGQSLALGEEAVRKTDFDSLWINYGGRIVTENLDGTYGYFDHSSRLKQQVKRLLHYDKCSFELSIYRMAEVLASELGEDTLVCVFPGGRGMTTLQDLMKPSAPYKKFMSEIALASEKARSRGWEFYVPAVCWMQGESDIADYPDYDYKEKFRQMYQDMNADVKRITHQTSDIRIVSYQATAITKGDHYKPNHFEALEPRTPEAQMELIRDDSLIWVSGPTYPYHFVREAIHIDADGQRSIGTLAAESVLGILRGLPRNRGLLPLSCQIEGSQIRIVFNVPCPPLCFDTVNVRKADNYGFNVVKANDTDIISDVRIDAEAVIITCNEPPIGCKLRYGINGEYLKGGWEKGSRGNLRDSKKGIPNWCCLFESTLVEDMIKIKK